MHTEVLQYNKIIFLILRWLCFALVMFILAIEKPSDPIYNYKQVKGIIFRNKPNCLQTRTYALRKHMSTYGWQETVISSIA